LLLFTYTPITPIYIALFILFSGGSGSKKKRSSSSATASPIKNGEDDISGVTSISATTPPRKAPLIRGVVEAGSPNLGSNPSSVKRQRDLRNNKGKSMEDAYYTGEGAIDALFEGLVKLGYTIPVGKYWESFAGGMHLVRQLERRDEVTEVVATDLFSIPENRTDFYKTDLPPDVKAIVTNSSWG
jgi:hypothetical protein